MNSGPPLWGITVNGARGLEVAPDESASEGEWMGGPGHDRAMHQGDTNLTGNTSLQ